MKAIIIWGLIHTPSFLPRGKQLIVNNQPFIALAERICYNVVYQFLRIYNISFRRKRILLFPQCYAFFHFNTLNLITPSFPIQNIPTLFFHKSRSQLRSFYTFYVSTSYNTHKRLLPLHHLYQIALGYYQA